MRAFPMLAVAAVLLAAPAQAQVVTVKLGTVAPDGSAWHLQLKEMGEKWSQASGGKVKLKIFAGGVAGNEGDMVRKMRVGQLGAAALSVVGLHDIEASPQALGVPGLLQTQEEFEHVFAKLAPTYDKRFIDKGFVPLMWGDTGWVHVFLKREIRSVAETRGMKVFAWAGDPSAVDAWSAAGFQPVVLSSTDILTSLSTGMIEGFATTPIMAFTARWYEQAKFMVDVPYGHLPGATLVTAEVWKKIPEDLRPKLQAIATEYGVKVNREVARMLDDSIAQMKKGGMKVIVLNETEKKAWTGLAEKSWAPLRREPAFAAALDEVKAARDAYRAAKTTR